MLLSLSIRNIVLIDRLDLRFSKGLGVLTGETGAGKSILLDSLGLAVGARGGPDLIRPGADKGQVIAEFDVPDNHPARERLREQDLEADGSLILRRRLDRSGRGRAHINDQPVSVGLLRGVGDALLEIQGQFDARGLLDPSTHRAALDAAGALGAPAARTAEAWRAWRDAINRRTEIESALEQSSREEEFLRFSVDEIATLNPQPDEEKQLAEIRASMMHHEKLLEGLNGAMMALTGQTIGGEAGPGSGGVNVGDALRAAEAQLARIERYSETRVAPALSSLQAADAEMAEAIGLLRGLSAELEHNPLRLDEIEERLFALRAVARKHGVRIDDLPGLRDKMAARLTALVDDGAGLEALRKAESDARQSYIEAASALCDGRKSAARSLDVSVMDELPPLKLERTAFVTRVETVEEPQWGPYGMDAVTFEIATNPGAAPGPLNKVASGGELSRIMLAIKLTLSRDGQIDTLVFDEVDAGVGGATAAAVGERLARLANDVQVLVVTHSPQVAARGADHWRIEKVQDAADARSSAARLDGAQRREEIARMISGATITEEARAAAARLLEGGVGEIAADLFAASAT